MCILFLVARQAVVDASHLHNSMRFAHSRAAISPPSAHVLLSMRGGASESASAWSAGSKYDYRTSLGSSPPNQNYKTPSYSQSQDDTKEEAKEAFADAFLQRDNRNRFIARVYAILTGQLLFTAGTIHAFHTNPSITDWMMMNPAGRKMPLIALIISTIAYWITLSSENLRQSSLLKWPLLISFTVGQSIAVGFIASIYAYSTVIKAMVTTATATLSVTLYTLLQKNPKYDLSQWGRALSGLGMVFLLYGLIHVLELFGVIPAGFLPYTEVLYCSFGAALFSLYLAYHTRMIVSGKSAKYQMNEKDYILGAMSLYSDIINIFLYILRIMGELDDK